jgi:hypothetical protein
VANEERTRCQDENEDDEYCEQYPARRLYGSPPF